MSRLEITLREEVCPQTLPKEAELGYSIRKSVVEAPIVAGITRMVSRSSVSTSLGTEGIVMTEEGGSPVSATRRTSAKPPPPPPPPAQSEEVRQSIADAKKRRSTIVSIPRRDGSASRKG